MRRAVLTVVLAAALGGCGGESERKAAGLPSGPFAHDFATLEQVTGAEAVADATQRAMPGAVRSAQFATADGARFDVFGYRDGQSALRARASLRREGRRVVQRHNLLLVLDDPPRPGERRVVEAVRELGSDDGGP